MAESFAMSVNAVHIHTSAKNNEGIDNLFQTIAANILKKNKPSLVELYGRGSIVITAQNLMSLHLTGLSALDLRTHRPTGEY